MPASTDHDPPGYTTGCFSMGCSGVFVLVGVLWPLLHLLDWNQEPEVMLLPMLIGAPAFIIAHLLAVINVYRQPATGSRWGTSSPGRSALFLIWGSILVFVVILLLRDLSMYLFDWPIRPHRSSTELQPYTEGH